MNKKLKLFIILLVIAGVITGTAFLLHYLKVNNREKKTVDVYPVDDLAYDPTMWSGAETLNGSVNVNNEQKIYVGATSHVAEIKVKEGDHVTVNQPLMIVEAMKTETTFVSTINGTIDKIYAAPGERVNTEDLLISFILDEEEE